MLRTIREELKAHAPFTAVGAVSGVWILLLCLCTTLPRSYSITLFWTLHPIHVVLSALATTGMYRLHARSTLAKTLLVGYLGSVGIATLSDSFIPYLGEWILDFPYRGLHLGFIEKWWLVNPLALAGIVAARFLPKTKVPHAGHVLLSTWASLFHMTMSLQGNIDFLALCLVFLFLFLAVWVPCCTSDIVFPLLFATGWRREEALSAEVTQEKLRVGGV